MWLKNFMLFFLAGVLSCNAIKFKVSREWNYLNFTWPSEDVYKTAIAKGMYIPENNIISGITYFEDSFYLTLPRMKNGVPATLARISAGIVEDTSPALMPFPTWEMNKLGDCNALQNVQNVEVDPIGQLWIIDGGRTETLSPSPTNRCPPKLVIYDIRKKLTTTTYTFPEHVASANASFLYDIVVDTTDGGYAYITDNSRRDPGIIVFSVKDHHSWKLRHSKTMRADPTAATFRVNGITISDPINIASIALGPKIHTSNDRIVINEDREVFFSPLSSLHLYSVNTSVLRNEMNGMKDGEYQGELKDYGLKASQSIGMIMDNQGILYYSLLATYSIARWDSHTSFQSGQKIIARDENFLEWPNSFAFDQTGNITVLVNKLNKFIYDKLNLNEINFRLITANVGGKSYVYDQEYEYSVEQTSTTISMLPAQPIDQGHFMPNSRPEPKPEPEPAPEPEPSAEPEPTPEHKGGYVVNDLMIHDQPQSNQTANDLMNHDQNMNHSHTESSTSANIGTARKLDETKSGVNGLVASFIALLFACALFVV